MDQRGQASDLLVYLLWPALRKSPSEISYHKSTRVLILMFQSQAHEHHRKLLQSMSSTTFPLEPVGHAAEVPESQRVNDEPFGQR